MSIIYKVKRNIITGSHLVYFNEFIHIHDEKVLYPAIMIKHFGKDVTKLTYSTCDEFDEIMIDIGFYNETDFIKLYIQSIKDNIYYDFANAQVKNMIVNGLQDKTNITKIRYLNEFNFDGTVLGGFKAECIESILNMMFYDANAKLIQRVFRRVNSDPQYTICRNRLLYEWNILNACTADYF